MAIYTLYKINTNLFLQNITAPRYDSTLLRARVCVCACLAGVGLGVAILLVYKFLSSPFVAAVFHSALADVCRSLVKTDYGSETCDV